MNPQWSHDVYTEEKKGNKMKKNIILIVIIGLLGYGLIELLGPILR